jgi:hypothetical protein
MGAAWQISYLKSAPPNSPDGCPAFATKYERTPATYLLKVNINTKCIPLWN